MVKHLFFRLWHCARACFYHKFEKKSQKRYKLQWNVRNPRKVHKNIQDVILMNMNHASSDFCAWPRMIFLSILLKLPSGKIQSIFQIFSLEPPLTLSLSKLNRRLHPCSNTRLSVMGWLPGSDRWHRLLGKTKSHFKQNNGNKIQNLKGQRFLWHLVLYYILTKWHIAIANSVGPGFAALGTSR